MTIEEAINKAVKGGWKENWYFSHFSGDEAVFGYTRNDSEDNPCFCKNIHEILLDPSFWQSLGKAMGWGSEKILIDEPGHPKEWMYDEHCSVCGAIIVVEEEGCPEECESDNAYIPSWLYYWHRFIDHLSEGKSIESFFETL